MNPENAMGKDVAISLFSSAVRPELWMRFYESLSSNTVPFEVIFIGNNPPKFKLPDNCHFIYSEVKPVQCLEIGSRYAIGDLIMPFADDCVFSEHALDNLYETFNKLNNDKIILSCRYVLEGKDLADEVGRYWADDLNSPIMPAAGLMKRKIWKQLGGIDRRFIAMFWDLDIAMRIYELGGRVILSKNVWIEELHWKRFWERKPRLFVEFGLTTDRLLLDGFWVIKNKSLEGISSHSIHCISTMKERGILSKTRLKPVLPFEDKHILTISQGPKGRWR